jgi:hypothetical protein
MSTRSSISKLPPEIRSQLEQRLIANGFSDYRDLSEWLAQQGYAICKSSLHKYGKSFEDRLSTLKLSHDFAMAYKQALPDDAGARSEVLTDLAQDTLFNMILQLNNKANLLDDDADDSELTSLSTILSKVTRAIGDINRSSVTVKRYAAEIKAKQTAKFNELESEGSKSGINAEFMHRLKTEVLGLV